MYDIHKLSRNVFHFSSSFHCLETDLFAEQLSLHLDLLGQRFRSLITVLKYLFQYSQISFHKDDKCILLYKLTPFSVLGIAYKYLILN